MLICMGVAFDWRKFGDDNSHVFERRGTRISFVGLEPVAIAVRAAFALMSCMDSNTYSPPIRINTAAAK